VSSKIRGFLATILIIFLIVQPLFDVYMAVIGESLDILGISVVTLLRTTTCVILVIIVAICQIRNRYKIKWLVGLITYLSLVVIYAIAHHMNIVLSDGYFVTQGIYNAITELMYVLRLVVPVILIYTVVLVKPNKEQVEKSIISVVFIISLVIIITNILKISYTSYATTSEIIEYNIFDWFTNSELPYKLTLSKGLFVSANQIGALLAILLPVVIMYIIKNNKTFTYIVFLFAVIAMLLVGTRVASYGFILITIAMLIGTIVIAVIRKQRIEPIILIAIFSIMLLGIGIYTKSPARNRTFLAYEDGMYHETYKEIIDTEEYITVNEFKEMLQDESKLKDYMKYSNERSINKQELRYIAMCKYIKENYTYHSITRKYIMDIYPYTQDPEFWFSLFEEPVSVKGDNRIRQSVIIKRIKEVNNNYFFDTLVGMGATPMNSRAYMIEKDLIAHYYNIGIVGIILFVAPYAAIVMYAGIVVLKDIKNRLTSRVAAYMIGIVMTYGAGYFAGHVIDEYIITIYVATISGLTINHVNEILGGNLNERDNA